MGIKKYRIECRKTTFYPICIVAAAGLMTSLLPPDKILDAQYHNQHINNMIYLIIYRGEKN